MKKQVWKNYFDVVILPPKEVSDHARKLSKGLARHGVKWTLGTRSFIPHISLYHIPVKPEKFDKFVSEVQKAVENFSPGYLKTMTVDKNLLMFDKPTWLQKLYLKIIRRTLKYFDRGYGADFSWPLHLQESGARFVRKYGTPQFGPNFKPHVTLTSFKNNSPKIKIKKAKAFMFKPTHIYICELGPSHSCQRIVAKIPFEKR